MIAQLGGDRARLDAGIAYLRKTQMKDGSWFGRWGVNYIYGTWSALAGLNAAGLTPEDKTMRRAADWLATIQNPDGGWGENCDSYRLDYKAYAPAPSTASQTAWALLGLMAAGEVDHPPWRGASSISSARRRLMDCGASRIIPAAAFPASSISTITAIRNSFRSGPWRATAISRRAIPAASRSGFEEGNLMTILAVTGLKREAEIAGGPGVVAVAGGGDARSLAEKLDALHGDIQGVISIGLGGGLSPLLQGGRCGYW